MLRTGKGLRAYPACTLTRWPAVSWMLAEDRRLLCHTQSSLFFTAVAVAQVSTHFFALFFWVSVPIRQQEECGVILGLYNWRGTLTTTWRNLKWILLSEWSHIPKAKCFMIPSIWHSEKDKAIYRDKNSRWANNRAVFAADTGGRDW